MNLQTLSSFALARMLSDSAAGSAFHRELQEELRSREEAVKHGDSKTPWLFSAEERARMKKKWGPKGAKR